MLSARGPGTGTCWTAMHKSPTELAQNAQWRMTTAVRLGATPDAGPRSTCALRKGKDGDMCQRSLATLPFNSFCCNYGGARNRPHRAVQCTLRRLVEQAGGYADMERHVPELYDWVQKINEPAPEMRCSRQTSACDARMQNVATKVRRNQGWLQLLGKRRKRSSTEWPCERWSSRPLGDLAARAKLLRDLVTSAAANGQCSPHAVGRWRTQLERVLLTAQSDTYLRALGCRVAERHAAEPPLLLAV